MIKLETTDGVLLSKILKEVSPTIYSSNKQINRLLDGTYHVQIIGESLKSKEATIISSYNQSERLNEIIDKGTPVVLFFLDKKFVVYINDAIDWKRINFAHGNKDNSYFEGKVLMTIKEEVLQ